MAAFSPHKLKLLRFERQLSQEALAAAAGVSPWSITVWERGLHTPRGISVAALARALGVRFDDLLDEQQPAAAVTAGRNQEIHAGRRRRGEGVRDANG